MKIKSENTIQQSTMKMLGYIFSRPILAGTIIGILIHLGKWVNYTINGEDYFKSITALADHGLIFATVDVMLSFIIPALVVSLSVKLAKLKEEKFYSSFPNSNPDLIIKCANDGSPKFANAAVKLLMQSLQIPPNDIAALIPEEINSYAIHHNKIPHKLIHQANGISIEYNVVVTDDGLVFLSGRQA